MAKIAWATKVQTDPYVPMVDWNAEDAQEVKTSVNDLYDVVDGTPGIYRALISQSGTGIPTLIELVNTTGLTFSTIYEGVGIYRILASAPIVVDKCFYSLGASNGCFANMYLENSGETFYIQSYLLPSGAEGFNTTNGTLIKTPIEIIIYP